MTVESRVMRPIVGDIVRHVADQYSRRLYLVASITAVDYGAMVGDPVAHLDALVAQGNLDHTIADVRLCHVERTDAFLRLCHAMVAVARAVDRKKRMDREMALARLAIRGVVDDCHCAECRERAA